MEGRECVWEMRSDNSGLRRYTRGADSLVGTAEGVLTTKCHGFVLSGWTAVRYVMTAKHSGSMEGRSKAGPQT